MKKRWSLKEYDNLAVKALQNSLGIDPLLCILLVQRGIRTYEEAKAFFRPSMEQLHDPFLLKDMSKAVLSIQRAINQQKRICLYGDYDVDGTTSTAMLYNYLKPIAAEITYQIPSRFEGGYGLGENQVEQCIEEEVELLICLDCGSRAVEAIGKARNAGMEVLVIDHHITDAILPKANALINPHRVDCSYPCKDLSTGALTFKLLQALDTCFTEQDYCAEDFLDLAALSLACDYMPLVGESRALCFLGIEQLNKGKRAALSLFLESNQEWTMQNICYEVGPLLNAAGRMQSARLVVDLLTASTWEDQRKCFRELQALNQLRKEEQNKIWAEVEAQLSESVAWREEGIICLYSKDWHLGVLGIIAAKVARRYQRPCVVLTQVSNGLCTGSIRAYQKENILQLLEQSSAFLQRFGGHIAAAGLTVEERDIEALFKQLRSLSRVGNIDHRKKEHKAIDLELRFGQITPSFWKILKQFEPHGPGNKRPCFLSKHLKDTGFSKLLKQNHLKLYVRQMGDESLPFVGIAFGLGAYYTAIHQGRTFHVCYEIQENYFRERKKLQLDIKDIQLD